MFFFIFNSGDYFAQIFFIKFIWRKLFQKCLLFQKLFHKFISFFHSYSISLSLSISISQYAILNLSQSLFLNLSLTFTISLNLSLTFTISLNFSFSLFRSISLPHFFASLFLFLIYHFSPLLSFLSFSLLLRSAYLCISPFLSLSRERKGFIMIAFPNFVNLI